MLLLHCLKWATWEKLTFDLDRRNNFYSEKTCFFLTWQKWTLKINYFAHDNNRTVLSKYLFWHCFYLLTYPWSMIGFWLTSFVWKTVSLKVKIVMRLGLEQSKPCKTRTFKNAFLRGNDGCESVLESLFVTFKRNFF